MKKTVALILALLMLVALCACASADNGGGKTHEAYVFKKGTVEIAIDAELAPIVEKLGDHIYYDEAPSCAHEGTSKYYTYAGIDIESYPKDGKDRVYMVALIDDTVSTVEGLRVGDSREDVIEIYGEPDPDSERSLLYKAEGMYLHVVMTNKGKTVSQIQYRHKDAMDND